MKRLFTLLAFAIFIQSIFAQIPQKISYQAIIRNSSDALVSSKTVGMKISILHGSVSGTATFVETHMPTTNANGLLSIEIGDGSPVIGTFAGINWSAGSIFIKTEIDPNGGTNYTITGVSQLLSVPYALYAKTAETATNVSIVGNETAFNNWDKDSSDDFNGTWAALTGKPTIDGSETKISAGANINVSGSGTIVNPYTISTTSSVSATHYVGELYGGGIVFYTYRDAVGTEHGLIASLTELSTSQAWSDVTTSLIGTTAQSTWNGQINSSAIIAQVGHTNSAASLCATSTLNGQTDWYLPSIDELNLLYNARFLVNKVLSTTIGTVELGQNFYWSSTEDEADRASFYDFSGDGANGREKIETLYVRAIRVF